MIHYVVTEGGRTSIENYLAGEGRAIADRMQVVCYSELARLDRLPLGTWVFTELDCLDTPLHDLAVLVAERLESSGDRARILNDPRRVRLRVGLLRAAHEAGVNEHRAWLASDIRFGGRSGGAPRTNGRRAVAAGSLRYPVFIRGANDHLGNLTPLLDSPRALLAGLASTIAEGARADELAIVEFCDTGDAHGRYRKYSAYYVDGCVLPRTIECSREWMVKWRARILDRERADDELRYCATNPHDAWIRNVFRLARIDYGRVDYGILDGRPRLWEINTHPWIGGGLTRSQDPPIVAYRAMIQPARDAFYEGLRNAWASIDRPAGEGEALPFDVPAALARAIERSASRRRRAARFRSVLEAVERRRGGYRATRAVRRALASIAVARLRLGAGDD